MILVGDPQNKALSESIAQNLSCELIYPNIFIFPDSEQRIKLDPDKILGQKVYILKSCNMPIDADTMQLAFLIDAAVRAGADKVIGIVPYLSYMRADHVFRTGEASPLEIVIKLIEAAGLNEIIIVDPHSIKIPEMFKIGVKSLSALSLFAQKINEIEPNKENITIVAPDMGGLRRIGQIDQLLGGSINKVTINKDRDYNSGAVKVAEYKGEIRGRCFIVDDIISTGKTILQAVEVLTDNGAEEVYVLATHPVFSKGSNKLLSDSKVKKIYVTNSIPVSDSESYEKLGILSISGLIAESITNG